MKIKTMGKIKVLSFWASLILCCLAGMFLIFNDYYVIVGLVLAITGLSVISTMVFYVLEEFYISKH